MKSTPGPWKLQGKTEVMSDRRLVANTGGYQDSLLSMEAYYENNANAILISKTPDLLEVVMMANDYFNGGDSLEFEDELIEKIELVLQDLGII